MSDSVVYSLVFNFLSVLSWVRCSVVCKQVTSAKSNVDTRRDPYVVIRSVMWESQENGMSMGIKWMSELGEGIRFSDGRYFNGYIRKRGV